MFSLKKIKSYFKFDKRERSGIFFLLLIIIALQIAYFICKVTSFVPLDSKVIVDTRAQYALDSLKKGQSRKSKSNIYPFNPNFITDYKGYTLGMSTLEIDRLHTYRSQERYVNSAKEFQEVTLVSDSLLTILSPYFKFPDWKQNKNQELTGTKNTNVETEPWKPPMDLNKATPEQLSKINGIGEILSNRIVKFRDRLGGFLVPEQLYDVYGLEPEVAKRALKTFKIIDLPKIEKININTATSEEISRLIYLKFIIAERMVIYRENVGTIRSFDELTKIEDFPTDKIERIKLYLML
ncbi:MAG: helix-hairpin-helix domain-containing protein [Bacteroidota bacterium]